MNLWFSTAIILCLALLAYSFYKYFRSALSLKKRILLFSLRAFFILLLLIAFIEPEIQFERIQKAKKTVPVLIDNSQSMQLFNPESEVLPFIETLLKLNNSHLKSKPLFKLYRFGDSLRTFEKNGTNFCDAESNFPLSQFSALLNKYNSGIIISDGNWTNRGFLHYENSSSSIYYLKLPPAAPVKSLSLSVDAPESISSDSTLIINCYIAGFQLKSKKLSLTCHIGNKEIEKKLLQIDSGTINQNITLRMEKLPAGIHNLKINASLEGSITRQYRHIVQVNQSSLTYASHHSNPSLDNHFILSAIGNNNFFQKPKKPIDSLDLLIITRWPVDIKNQFSTLKKNGLIMFAGCIPCSTSSYYQTKGFIVNMSQFSPLNKINSLSFPPATVLKNNCGNLPLSNVYAWVTTLNNQTQDTVPAVFTSTFLNKKTLILQVKNFWKWDFIPLGSTEGEEHSFSFSSKLIETAKELILQNSSENYISFPQNQISETDSLEFIFHLPGNILENNLCISNLSIRNNSGIILETTFKDTIKRSGLQSYMIPPLQSGTYFYQSSTKSGLTSYTYDDSFFISNDNREYSVKNLNEFVLNEIGKPLTHTDSASIFNLFYKRLTEPGTSIKDSVRINRNWILLTLIFTIYCVELVLRRKSGLF